MRGVNAEAGWQSRHQRAALCRNNHTVTVSFYKDQLRRENSKNRELQSTNITKLLLTVKIKPYRLEKLAQLSYITEHGKQI